MGTDGRTDRHDEANSCLSQILECAKKHILEAGIFTLLRLKTEGASTVLDRTERGIVSQCCPLRISSEQRNKHSTSHDVLLFSVKRTKSSQLSVLSATGLSVIISTVCHKSVVLTKCFKLT